MKAYTELRAEYLKKIDEKTRELENLKSELAGVERLYRVSEGIQETIDLPSPEPNKAQRKVKEYVLGAVVKRGDRGVNVAEVIRQGREDGRELNQSSVSSLLSRLKREGTLKLHNDRYYPAQLDLSASTVRPLRPVEAA